MAIQPAPASNVKQAVPFFNVSDIDASLRFYVEGLGFVLKNQWTPEDASVGACSNSTMSR